MRKKTEQKSTTKRSVKSTAKKAAPVKKATVPAEKAEPVKEAAVPAEKAVPVKQAAVVTEAPVVQPDLGPRRSVAFIGSELFAKPTRFESAAIALIPIDAARIAANAKPTLFLFISKSSFDFK